MLKSFVSVDVDISQARDKSRRNIRKARLTLTVALSDKNISGIDRPHLESETSLGKVEMLPAMPTN